MNGSWRERWPDLPRPVAVASYVVCRDYIRPQNRVGLEREDLTQAVVLAIYQAYQCGSATTASGLVVAGRRRLINVLQRMGPVTCRGNQRPTITDLDFLRGYEDEDPATPRAAMSWDTPGRQFWRLELVSEMNRLLSRLSAERREFVRLYYYEGEPYKAIAFRLGCKYDKVNNELAAARRQLRQMMMGSWETWEPLADAVLRRLDHSRPEC